MALDFPSGPTNGQIYQNWQWDGAKWAIIPSGGTITISGDVTGSGTASIPTTVTRLQTKPVSATAPTTSQVLQWSGTQWAPATVSGGAGYLPLTGGTLSGALTVNTNAAALPAAGTGYNLRMAAVDGSATGLVLDTYGGGLGPLLHIRYSGGTAAAPTATAVNNYLGIIEFYGRGATGFNVGTPPAYIAALASENFTDTAQGASIRFITNSTGTTNQTQRVAIQHGVTVGAPSGGDLGPGTINAAGNITVGGNYLYLGGATGTVNSTGGPLIFGDNNNIVIKSPGTGSNGVWFQNATGAIVLTVNSSGNLTATGEIISSRNGVGFRLANTYGTLIYSDPNSFYILITNSGDPYGTFNSLRPFYIVLNTGNVYMGHSLNVTATTSSAAFQLNGANFASRDASGTYISDGARTCLQLQTGNLNQYFANVHYFYTGASVSLCQFQNGAPYCYKPGGGTWGDTSDRRIKENVRPYTRSLDAIRALQCVTYQHNGRGETTRDGQTYIGLVADDVEDIMPEMVGRMSKKLDPDDSEPTELRTLDATALIYALVNSVQELASRVVMLESRHEP